MVILTLEISVRPEQINVRTIGKVENNKVPRKLVKLSKRNRNNKKRPIDPNINIKPSINIMGQMDKPSNRNIREVRNGMKGGLTKS